MTQLEGKHSQKGLAMSIQDCFIQAILDNPDAELPRLRLADWLDEHCDPRGEFIRVQFRLEKPGEDSECLFELERRERELLDEFEPQWTGELAGMVDMWVFRRGFVEEVGTTAERFLAHSRDIFCMAPVRELHLNELADRLEDVVRSPHWGRARFLDISGNRIGNAGARLLAESSQLAGIRGLNLSDTGLGDAGVAALATSVHVQGLRELYLDGNRIGRDGVHALIRSTHLGNLKTLSLGFNGLGREEHGRLKLRFGHRVHV
jgi:uncharacterized protein (TIGR02996 family)